MAVTGLGREETCIVHHDRPAAARCGTCHKPVCSTCVVSTAAGKFCSHECATKAADFRKNFKKVKSGGGAIMGVVKMCFWLAVLIVLLGVMNKYACNNQMPAIGSYLNKLPVLGTPVAP